MSNLKIFSLKYSQAVHFIVDSNSCDFLRGHFCHLSIINLIELTLLMSQYVDLFSDSQNAAQKSKTLTSV